MGALPSAAVVAALAVVATPSPGQAGTTNYTFDYTGGPQTWVVPAGVTQATFSVVGAQGGSAGTAFGVPVPGGFGGRAVATLAVTPGETINIFGKGADFRDDLSCTDRAGGFNGGGDAGVNNTEIAYCGQGGGGASDVRIGGVDLSNRVLVAGGGGGAASNLLCAGAGDGGGLTGGSANDNSGLGCTQGGKGGNQDGSSGSGQLGVGSAGGEGAGGIQAPGGGGGGGYYGGAGGQGDGYGGGGGSGFGPAGTTFENGVNQGNGSIGIALGAGMEPLPDTGPGTSTTILVVGLALLIVGVVLVRLPQRRPTTASRPSWPSASTQRGR